AFAIALNGATGAGSGRSIPGVDLGRAVRSAVEQGVLVKGGGHAMAAGLTVATARLADLRAHLEAALGPAVARARAEAALRVDAALTAGGARPELVADVERAGPFGAGNPEPVFALADHLVVDVGVVGGSHVRLRLESGDRSRLDAIAFRCAESPLGRALLASRGERLHVAGTLTLDRWGGGERVRLRVLDAAPARPVHGR
ncbi:MAG TPA: DHHA1 domain-containing protein, partial [Capillimicrobium sp.]